MNMQVTLPNGMVINDVPENITKKELAKRLVSGGMATYEELGIADPLAEERTFGGQLFETAKGIPRGFLGSFLTAGEGIAELADAATNTIGLEDLIDSGEDNAMVSLARDGRAALQESLGADEAYRDTWMTKFGDGLGSFASFLTPGLIAKGLGATGKLIPTAGAVSLAVGSGAGDQAQRIQRARDQGIEVSQEDEDLAIGFFGAGIGLTELAAPTRLLSRLSKNVDPATKIGIKEKLTGALGTGVVEGVQEAMATVLQDATERGIYNENLAKSDSMFDDFTVGGAVGAFADLALGGAKGRRRQMGSDAQNENQANAKEILEKERQNLAQEVSSAQAVYEEELAATQGLAPPELDLGEIAPPRRGEFFGAAGSSGAYLNVIDKEGNEFQGEEKTAFTRDGKEKHRYVRRFNDDGKFTNVIVSRNGVPVEGVSSQVVAPAPQNIPSKRSEDPMLAYAMRIRGLAGGKFLLAGKKAREKAARFEVAFANAKKRNEKLAKSGKMKDEVFTFEGKKYSTKEKDYIPDTSFSVKEQTVSDGTQFQVEDSDGNRYGKPFASNQREEAISLAGNLNEQMSDAEIAQKINTAIDNSEKEKTARFNTALTNAKTIGNENFTFEGKEYSTKVDNREATLEDYNLALSPDERSTMFAYGWKTLNIDQNTYTSAEVNQAGETTVIEGFDEQLSNEDINNTAPSKLTMSQRINKKRMAKGKTPTNSFTIEEVKGVLKDKLGNIRTGEIETETYAATTLKDKNGKSVRDKNGNTIPVVQSSSGEVITGHVTGLKKGTKGEFEVKPFVNIFDAKRFADKREADRNLNSVNEAVFANKNIRIPELDRLLDSKNLVAKVGSPEFRVMIEAFTGVSKNKRIDDLSNAEMKILYQKIRSLPQFADPTPLVNFLPTKKPAVEAVQEEVVQEEVIPDDQPQLLLPQKTLGQERLEVIQKALDERMNKTGLGDIKATISRTLQNVLRNAEGELVSGVRQRGRGEVGGESFGGSASLVVDNAPPSDVQAFYSTPTGEIFLGLDRIDSTLPIEQQVDAALELLNHEQIHAMREANLFTDKEWEILSNAANNTKSDQVPDKTFLQVAVANDSKSDEKLSQEGLIEEAVAELVRAARRNPNIISGKPKNLIGRIVELFARLKGFITNSGYTNFESLVADIEGGTIGARERGARISKEMASLAAQNREGQRTPDFIPEVSEELDPENPNSEVEIVSAMNDKFSRTSPVQEEGSTARPRERADGSTVGSDPGIQKVTRDAGAVQKAVDKNEKDAVETSADYVPRFSFRADPEAQYVAQNPEEGITPSPILTNKFSRRNSPELDPIAQAAVTRAAGSPQTDATPGETYLESVQSFVGGLSKYLVKVKQETVNNYAELEILTRDPIFKDHLADTSSIAAAMLADRSMGLVASALKSGAVAYDGGMTQVVDFIYINKSGVRKKYKGLVDVMAALYSSEYGSLEELAQAYTIARRADRLRKQGLSVPTEAGDLAVLEAEIAKFKNKDGIPIIEEWYDVWQAYNNFTVEYMKDTGIVDDALAQKWLDMSDYIPFYRQGEVAEGENVDLGKDVPQMFKRNMTTAVRLTKLKGSEKSVNVPMLDAITRNLTMAIDAGMKNVAQQRIVRDMIELGLAKKATPEQRKNKTQHYVVSFKVKGVEQHYSIKDPLVYESMQPIAAPHMATAFVGGPSKLLREMITRDPGFMFANMMRDTLSAYVTSGSSFIPVIDTIKNINLDFEQLERFGVVGGYDFSNDPDDVVRAFGDYSRERGIDVDGKGDSVGIFKKLWNWSGNATTASDAATRKAVYNDVLARTGNEAEAAWQALEVINFSRRGRNSAVRLLTTAIPFLNARFQGLDVLYRGFMGYNSANRENSRKQAVTAALMRGSIITSTTVAYWLMFSDEEEYKQATDEQRDLNWILSLPKSFGVDVPLRIPVPFEVGLIFKTIPERILDTYGVAEVFGKTGQTSQRELGESLKRGIGETLAVNPLGAQIVAPLIEAVWNKNFFTGRDIVPFYLSQNRSQGLISRASNTEVSKLLGEATNISPMKIDHVMYGYVGTIGGYLIDAVDEMIFKNPAVLGDKGTAAPTKDFTQLPVMKRFFLNKFSSGDVQDFYDLRKEVQTLSGDLKLMAEEGRMDEYEAVFRARGHLLGMKDSINYTSRRLTKLRKQRQIVERSELSSDLKRDMIDEIQKEIELAVSITPTLKRLANLPVMKNIGT